MKLLNMIVCVCFTLSLIGCAAQRPHTSLPPIDALVAADTPTAEPPSAKAEPEHPVWDKCKKTAGTAAMAVLGTTLAVAGLVLLSFRPY